MSNATNTPESIQAAELCAGLTFLKAEHVPLLEKIDSLLVVAEQIKNGENLFTKFAVLKTQTEIFKAELEPHSHREEEALFSLLAAYMDPASGPIAVNTGEHNQVKSLLESFLKKTENDKLTASEMKESAELIINAANMLKNHFAKEENILFPKAEGLLTDEEKIELYRKLQK